MKLNEMCRSALCALVIMVGAAAAHAQCEPSWDTTLGNPGINDGYIGPIASWDDGDGDALYVGGSAQDIGGSGLNDYLARYDPVKESWSRLGSGIGQGSTNAFLTKIIPWDNGDGEQLYVVGQFAMAGGLTEANSFARWDGSSWEGVGAGFTQSDVRVTYDILPADLGDGEKLYLAGNWSRIGPVDASGVALYDGKAFGTWGTGDGIGVWGGFSPFVARLAMWDDGSGPAVYACGRFKGIDGASTSNVARYNVTKGEWEAFERVFPTTDLVNMTSWAVFDDGDGEAIYVGGQAFRVPGDSAIYIVAKWDGTKWTGIGQPLSGRVTDLRVWDDGTGPALYLAGTAVFEVNYFAKLVGNTWVPARRSGVNNPPVSGNFSSAFGLYEWRRRLVVGGTFSQVGGLDPVTGVGEGTPIPARGMAALVPTADFDASGDIGFGDLVILLSAWGDEGAREDLDGNGFVDFDDLTRLLSSWGECV